jgi:hypothetical protein
MSAPDLIEEVVGWRAWRLQHRHPRVPVLCSLVHANVWPTDAWMVADCGGYHTPPGEHCRCGIYAARSHQQLVELGYAACQSTSGRLVQVIGEVGLAGRVVVAEQGFRAERARPRRLWVPYAAWELVASLRAVYRVPVELGNPLHLDRLQEVS